MEDAPTAPDRRPLSTAVWIGASILLVVLVVGVWLRVGGERAGAELSNAIISGKRPAAPALPTTDVPHDGAPGLPKWYRADESKQLANANGHVLVVNWWASWCGPCEDEAPALKEIADDYDGRVSVVGLNAGSQDLESDARAFVKRHELDFTIVRADRADEDAWGTTGFPETFVVGTDGRISSFINGPIDEDALRGLLDRELAEDRA
jgi:thiol-disulfide isomerase/thioredoxin